MRTPRWFHRRASATLLLLSVGLTAGCAQILGIEDTALAAPGAPIRPLVYFFTDPLTADPATIPVFVLTNADWEATSLGLTGQANAAGRGDLFFEARDCDDRTIAGVTFDIDGGVEDADTTRFTFFEDNNPAGGGFMVHTDTVIPTDSRGALGAFNLGAGTVNVTVRFHEDGGNTLPAIGTTRIFIGADQNATGFFTPNNYGLSQAEIDALNGTGLNTNSNNFDCLAAASAPRPDPLPDMVTFDLDIADFGGNAVAGIEGRACPSILTPSCSSPDTSGISDVGGNVMLTGGTGSGIGGGSGFSGFVLITGDIPIE